MKVYYQYASTQIFNFVDVIKIHLELCNTSIFNFPYSLNYQYIKEPNLRLSGKKQNFIYYQELLSLN